MVFKLSWEKFFFRSYHQDLEFFSILPLFWVSLGVKWGVYELEKEVSVIFKVVRGGKCQQTSPPRYLSCKLWDNSWRNMQDCIQRGEVLAQLERKWMEGLQEKLTFWVVKLFSKQPPTPILGWSTSNLLGTVFIQSELQEARSVLLARNQRAKNVFGKTGSFICPSLN